jgi:hypothetical protein
VSNIISEVEKVASEAQKSEAEFGLPLFTRGRLTLESGVPVSLTNQTAKTILYFTPFRGCYDFEEYSLDISGLAADTNYDIFYKEEVLYPVAWTNDTTRATALVLDQGYLKLSTDEEQAYIGTIRMTSTAGQCEDSLVNRFVWNYYNRLARYLYTAEGTNHSYGTAVARLWNNSLVNNLLKFVVGIREEAQNISFDAIFRAGTAGYNTTVNLYLNGVSFASQLRYYGAQYSSFCSSVMYVAGLGYNYASMYEYTETAGSDFDIMHVFITVKG